jgi:glucan 1,3-beta-glucosidase
MVRFSILAALSWALGASAAVLDIPSVDAAVNAALKDYGNYAAYTGPQKKPPATTKVPLQNALLSDGPSSFWQESISHQGISAFGSSGYQVFRNVKDFGAKGNLIRS